MSLESQDTDRKSLRAVTGRTADWDDLARACVCFANGAGGRLLIGIEDGETEPPAGQAVPGDLIDRLRKRISELTVNVQALPTSRRAANGGEFVEVIVERSPNVASTSDGRYFLRVADTCVPVVGDDVLRLANERPGRPWEAMDSGVPRAAADPDKRSRLVEGIRASDRVKDSVKEKDADELLTHYGLAQGTTLTRLGVLLLSVTVDRWALGTAPLVQAIKYENRRNQCPHWGGGSALAVEADAGSVGSIGRCGHGRAEEWRPVPPDSLVSYVAIFGVGPAKRRPPRMAWRCV